MRQQLVYDLPTRIFHWLFSGLFLVAFLVAKLVDDESSAFSYHMLAGLILSFVVILRIPWGFFGTRYARFSAFALNPRDLLAYFKGILSGSRKLWVGPNPASSWAAILMMVIALCLGITGFLMTSGINKSFEDFHEFLAYGFLFLALTHIAGIVLHTIRHKDLIGPSMIHGKKACASANQAITSARPAFGVLMIGLVVVFGLNLFNNYDSQHRSLQFFGSTLQLTKNEDSEKEKAGDKEGAENTRGKTHELKDADGDKD